jgi:UPF0716 family protein affecting phage T7 exclusion
MRKSAFWLLVAVWVVAEVASIILVAHSASWRIVWWQFAATAMLGAGVFVYASLHHVAEAWHALETGEDCNEALIAGLLLLPAAVALAIPGLVSDVVGLALLAIPVRAAIAGWWVKRFHVASPERAGATYPEALAFVRGNGGAVPNAVVVPARRKAA